MTIALSKDDRSTWSGLVFLISLFPYVGFGSFGFGTEVQPWAALVGWTVMMAMFLRGRLQVRRFHLVLLVFSIFFLLYIRNQSDLNFVSYARKSVAFLMSFSLVVLAQYLRPSQMLDLLKPAALLWFAFAMFGIVAPNVYLQVVQPFIPNAVGSYGERGVTSLAPEATDFGFTMAYFWLLTVIASEAAIAEGKAGAPVWLKAVILLSILLSRSASGIFAIALLVVLSAPAIRSGRWRAVKMLALGLAIALATAVVLFGPNPDESSVGIRGIDLLILAVTSPLDLIETTFSYRLAHNLVGIFGMLDSGMMGWGAGTFTTIGPYIYQGHDIGGMLGVSGWYATNIPSTISVSPLAIFPVILFEYGLFGALYVIYIFSSTLTSGTRGKVLIAALLFMTWSQSFPVAYPLFWVLLGLTMNERFQSGLKTSATGLAPLVHVKVGAHTSPIRTTEIASDLRRRPAITLPEIRNPDQGR